MKDVPNMMARCYCSVHDKIENADSELIVISLEEFQFILDIGTIWLMHWYCRYTPTVFPNTAPGDSIVYKPDESVNIDMAGPSMDDNSGPIFHLQWKPRCSMVRYQLNGMSSMVKRVRSNTNRNSDSNQNPIRNHLHNRGLVMNMVGDNGSRFRYW
jgi:hypothetical protein